MPTRDPSGSLPSPRRAVVLVSPHALANQRLPRVTVVKRLVTARSAAAAVREEKPLVTCIIKLLKQNNNKRAAADEDPRVVEVLADTSESHEERSYALKYPAMLSRTNLKQQLMREQLQQLEKKEASEKRLSSSAPTHTSSAIKVPLYSSPGSVQVPREVLKVKTGLENPTPYHVRESQQRQVRQYLSQSHHNVRALSLPTSPPPVSSSLDPSPSSPLSAALSSTATSPSELEEFWQDFRNLGSVNDADSVLDPGISLPTTVSETNFLDILSNTLIPALGNVSTSCPAVLADVSEEGEGMHEEAVQAFVKDRQKKDNHNRIERRRRYNINDRIKELGTLLPRSSDPYYDLVKDLRQNKGTILKASVDYVKCLKKEVSKIPALENRCRQIEQINRKLLLQIQALELQLKENGIPVSKSTWYPSSRSDLHALIQHQPVPPGGTSSAPSNSTNPLSPMVISEELANKSHDTKLSNMQVANSAPCNNNNNTTRHPIMQFLKVKQEPQITPSSSPSSGLSSAPCGSPVPLFGQFEDLMMEDDHPVTGDPMLSSRDPFSPDHMDFMA